MIKIYKYALCVMLLLITFSVKSASAQKTDIYQPVNISLNGTWHFKTDPNQEGESLKWFKDSIDICSWDSMTVPGNWDLENRYADYVGKAWYRRSFRMPDGFKNKMFRLTFESTSYYAKFWLNGQYLGESQFGLLPHYFDIKDKINEEGDNILTVEVDNTFKLGALWNWGGIRRPVWIEITDPHRLDYQHITAIPNLEAGDAEINIKTVLENQYREPDKVDLKYSILYKGKPIKEKWQKNVLLERSRKTIAINKFHLDKEQVHLWGFDHPHLYESEISLFKNGERIQGIKNQFGIRKIEVDGYELKLNGNTIRPVGYNLVPDDRTTGNTLPLWRIKQDVDMMKSLGANMARISHLPLPEDFLDYLDQKGILVFSEVSLWGKNRMVNPDSLRPKKWLKKLIKTQYNHPSIIGWSVGNEIGYIKDNPNVMGYVKSAIHHAEQLDSNRLAIYVSHSAAAQKQDPVEYEDIIFFNKYNDWGKEANEVHRLHPGKPVFYSEFGENIVDEDPNKGIINASKMLNDIRGRKYLIGASLWTFNDYRSNYTGTGPSENRAWGVVNVFRQPKRAYYSFKKEFAPVKRLEVETEKDKNHHIQQLKITITPRTVLDIPSYTLSGYKIIWTVLDKKEKITDGGWITLRDIYPGEKPFSRQLNLQKYSDEDSKIKVSLVSPQMYAVLDTVIYLAPPSTPQIKAVYSSPEIVRIGYDKVPDAESYKIIYSDGEKADTTEGSMDDFIEIKDLKSNKIYSFRVIAVNNYGISFPSSSVTAKLNENELPPVIWKSIPSDHGFFVGYSSTPEDIFYDIEYGTAPHHYSHKQVVKNKGVLKISGLENGQTYYYRLRSVKQWGFKSEWSLVNSVVPDGDLKPPTPQIKGVIYKGDKALICFNPVSKAIGYKIIKKRPGEKLEFIPISSASIEYFLVPDVKKGDVVYIKAVNQYGMSKEVKVTPY